MARRIVCWVDAGSDIPVGERIGIIRFGSRLDVYLPTEAVPRVAVGQTAIAGETVIAEFGQASAPAARADFPEHGWSPRPKAETAPPAAGHPVSSWVVPNLITVLSICAGLSGVRMALEGRIDIAVMLVLVAALLGRGGWQGGRAMMKATSPFGAQMDSLADNHQFRRRTGAGSLHLHPGKGRRDRLVGSPHLRDRLRACAWRASNIMLDDPDRPVWKNDYFLGVPAPRRPPFSSCFPIYLGLLGVKFDTGLAVFAGVYVVFVAALADQPAAGLFRQGERSAREKRSGDAVMLVIVFYVALAGELHLGLTMTASALAVLGFLPFSYRAYRRRESSGRPPPKKQVELAASQAARERDRAELRLRSRGPACRRRHHRHRPAAHRRERYRQAQQISEAKRTRQLLQGRLAWLVMRW